MIRHMQAMFYNSCLPRVSESVIHNVMTHTATVHDNQLKTGNFLFMDIFVFAKICYHTVKLIKCGENAKESTMEEIARVASSIHPFKMETADHPGAVSSAHSWKQRRTKLTQEDIQRLLKPHRKYP